MDRVLLIMLILRSLDHLSAKHVLVNHSATWQDAQEHCRKNYTDLSPISNEMEYEVFKRFFWNRTDWPEGWIGLYQNSNSPTKWTWSGGANATHIDYVPFHPTTGNYMYWNKHGLYSHGHHHQHFFCFNLVVDDVKKTWEEALEHCRRVHTDLTSLHSETEQRLALRKIRKLNISELVWIGLRYLEGGWLWVDGDPLVYDSWPKDGDQGHQCPIRKRCGALTKKGHWRSLSCETKLIFICY